jgi:hypothetical protein
MLVARWLFLAAGVIVCVCVVLFLATGDRRYWRAGRGVFLVTVGAGLAFFVGLAIERIIS